jgi:N-methylhydantoinase A
MLSDLKREIRTMQFQSTRAFAHESAARAFAAMVSECERFTAQIGAASSTMAFSAEARYPDQVWELDLPIRDVQFGSNAAETIESDFHRLHERLFEVSDPGSPVEIIGWAASVSCRSGPQSPPHLQLPPPREPTSRRLTLVDGSSVEAKVYDYSWLERGKRFRGPALVEMPLTTVVVDRETASFTREATSLVIGFDS